MKSKDRYDVVGSGVGNNSTDKYGLQDPVFVTRENADLIDNSSKHETNGRSHVGRGKMDEDSGGEKPGYGDVEWERRNLRYGWGKWTPQCLQKFNCIQWYIVWVCLFSLVQGFIVNGVINAVITTLERRFDLPSSKSGLIASSNDFLAFFLVLAISFYGSERHKPRIIGIGVLVLAAGSILFSLPHFLTGLYTYHASGVKEESLCLSSNSSDVIDTCTTSHTSSTSWLASYLYVFMLANALHGVGSTPMFTLGSSFIDENSRAEQTPFFLGLIYCIASLGVAAGYMGGGQFLNMYVDIGATDTSQLGITPMDPRWVGAWWVPFLIGAAVLFIVAVPILGYPRQLPGSYDIQKQRKLETSQAVKRTGQEENMGKSWKQFPRAMINLVRNPTFLFLSLSGCAEGMIISGMATFGPKFLQEKFNLPAAFASFVMGIITVPGAGGGMLLGGFIVRRWKLRCPGIIRLNMTAAVLGLLISALFWLQCPVQKIAGITATYTTASPYSGHVMLADACNAECACPEHTYEPVCGVDGIIYFTPCHAGCDDNFTIMEGPMGPFKMYNNCSCVASGLMYQHNNTSHMTTPPLTTTTVAMTTETIDTNSTGPPMGAFQGICMSDCQLLYVVGPLLFVGMLLTFMTCSPTQTATMRCVQPNQRSIAIGMQWLLLRLLGTTPGPLMLGAIMDSACHVWQTICGEAGFCWIYEKNGLGVKLFVWWLCVKLASLCFNFAAVYFYKAPPDDDDCDGKKRRDSVEDDRYLLNAGTVENKESVI